MVLCLVLVGTCTGVATTYYISYNSGNDANPGTKAQPWKYHPRMWGWSGSYSHVAGDAYIFKGGETWPNNCFTFYLLPGWSGTVGNPDTYGVDVTWFTGAYFIKPKFDLGGQELVRNADGYDVVWDLNGNSNLDIDSIDMTGLYWSAYRKDNGRLKDQFKVAYLATRAGINVNIKNCNFRNWTHEGYRGGSYEDMLICIIGMNQSPYNAGSTITNCVFDGENQANQYVETSSCQAAVFGWGGRILNCTVRNSAGGLFPAGAPVGVRTEIAGCTIGPLYRSYDPTMHHDGIQDNGGAGLIIHDNYMRDVYSVPIFIGAGWGGGRYDVFNNVFDLRNQTTQCPITFDAQSGGNSFYIYNNTLVAGPGLAIFRANYRPLGGNNILVVDIKNNMLIGDGATIAVDNGVTIGTYIEQYNVKKSYADANSLGYTRANWFKPTTLGSPTVEAGTDLSSYYTNILGRDILGVSRPQITRWDVGAYEFTAGQVNPGNIVLGAASYSTSVTNASVVIPVYRLNGSDGAISCTCATANGTALAGVDYYATSGTVSFANGVTTPGSVTIPIINTGKTGTNNLTFTLALSGSPLGSPSSATISISLLPPPPPAPVIPGKLQFTASGYTVLEAGPSVLLSVQRVNGTNGAVSATYATADGSAVAGHDYTSTSGTLNWIDTEGGSKLITVPIINSGDAPGTNRTFTVALTTAVPGDPTNATVTIIMDNPPPPPPVSTNTGVLQFSGPSYSTSVTNGTVTLYVQRLTGTNGAASVSYVSANDTAVSGTDYVAVSGTLNWTAGDNAAKPISVPIINTGTVSVLPRRFLVYLTSATGASLGTPVVARVVIAMDAPINIRAIIGNAVIGNAVIGR